MPMEVHIERETQETPRAPQPDFWLIWPCLWQLGRQERAIVVHPQSTLPCRGPNYVLGMSGLSASGDREQSEEAWALEHRGTKQKLEVRMKCHQS